jgi:CAAX prenyl protease-like protein
MNLLREKLSASPIHSRVIPYVLIVVLAFMNKRFGEEARYWVYLCEMIVGAWCVWEMRSLVPEMKWAFSWEAIVAGVAVCAIWIFLDPYYHHFGAPAKEEKPWNPFAQFGEASAMGWFFFWVRTLGSAIVVPPIEEVFYRSFLYRYCVRTDFENMPLNRFHPTSFIVVSLMFGFAHYEWLSGVLCGLIFQGLVVRKNRLGDAMLAHGITNFLLGLWAYWKGDWKFW